MPYGPQKLILINAGRYDFAEVELSGSLQIVGPNNTGKTTLINTLQYLYLDDRRYMDFGAYSPEQTRDYYFANQYSYILFQCLGARGQFVFGWRGQSKAAGIEPERFYYEGPFQTEDFLDPKEQVREPNAVSARLASRQFALAKTAHDHREILLLATKGESRGAGLVSLRENDRYPQFRETLKNLLSLSTITQDQMRERLLMLASLSTEKYALNVRELFGEDYDKIRERKWKLNRFKEHQSKVEIFVDLCNRRNRLRAELVYRWQDLRPKREAFTRQHESKLRELEIDAATAEQQIGQLSDEVDQCRKDMESLAVTKGGLLTRIGQIADQGREFADVEPDLARIALKNVNNDIQRLKTELSAAETQPRAKVETKLRLYQEIVSRKQRTITHFERALITVLRRSMNDDDLSLLARLFNFDLLETPIGEDGIRLKRPNDFTTTLGVLRARIDGDVYRDGTVEVPLPISHHSLAELENPDAVRQSLEEEEETLRRCEGVLKAIDEKEKLQVELQTKEGEGDSLVRRLIGWEGLQKTKAELPQIRKELRQVELDLETAAAQIAVLDKNLAAARDNKNKADRLKVQEENQFNAAMGRFNECVEPDWVKSVTPDEAIPDDFDVSVALFLRQQQQMATLDDKARDALHAVEKELGSDYSGADENETARLLTEELEALADKENALGRDWDHLLHELRATFDQVLRSLGDIQSAAGQLNRRLAAVPVSNLAALRMDVVEQSDIVSSLRRLANLEQPGLFEDSSSLETAIESFRKKFDATPLLRYGDLFTLRFTVTGDDGKPHHYHNLDQVESHGTTMTIKVLFNLLVLRSLLREDASKSPMSEVPFFLDEIHSLDVANRRAIISTARQLGFIAITAAPESVSEVNALYYVRPQRGRVVLRKRHRIGIKPRHSP
jgi:uncharacterized coiled-coil protein SlyX